MRRSRSPRRSTRTCSRSEPSHCTPRAKSSSSTNASAPPTSATDRLMANFFQHVVAGLANGGIYATLALALVLIHRATGILNFAQGEMGMFATYIAWTLINSDGLTYWLAFTVTLAI